MNNKIKIVEDELTEDEVKGIHGFGRDWIIGYDSTSRAKWEAALRLYALDNDVEWGHNRRIVPTGKDAEMPRASGLITLDEWVKKEGLGKHLVYEHTKTVRQGAHVQRVDLCITLYES